ncbi:PI-PLC X domain-containing protein 1 [Diachasma alloeum]|uniref:PI-PLC X domain-containing protein 1 n=1 Tax=Diachasma alloeum TaxID=454923 RepID=UPI000738477A|nr:PI-PLC X domain-containing protein 1 [Diachasma alloeum]
MYSIFFLSIIHLSVFDGASCQDNPETLIILTLSPVQQKEPTREIGVYFYCPGCASSETLTVYDQNQQTFESTITDVSGFMKTGLQASPETFPNFTAQILRDGKQIYSTRGIDRANWMHDNKSLLKHLSLPQLVIPGTHQSGAYERPDNLGIWNLCQDLSIEEQLDLGIRYLDIQPSCERVKNQCKSFYVEYSLLKMMSMGEVFSEMKAFLNRTNEIVILSFSDFSSEFQSDEDHGRFMKYIKKELGDYLYPLNTTSRGWSTSLKKIWSAEKRVVVSYNYRGPVDPVFGTGVEQSWCYCKRSDDLHVFFADPQKREEWASRTSPSVDVVQLTPDWEMIVPQDSMESDSPFNFKAWTDEFSPKVCEWYHEEWNISSNVIVVDFFEATGIVDLAVYWNLKRGKKHQSLVNKN